MTTPITMDRTMIVKNGSNTRQTVAVGLIGFLTLVDLFAAQAILPTLARAYAVTPGQMGLAVNASTFGMAAAGLIASLFSGRLKRRRGICGCLLLLALPTLLLASAPNLALFAALRVAQGVFMATAFTLTMAYLAEQCTSSAAGTALAAYITGGVASNLVGRLLAGFMADRYGLPSTFYTFAALNVIGMLLVFCSLADTAARRTTEKAFLFRAWAQHLANPSLRASFGMGFLILFAFIGTYTYVNFVLSSAPLSLSPMSLGLVYLVFLPSMFTTPLAGRLASRYTARETVWVALAVAGSGLPMLLFANIVAVLAGLVLVGVGTFFAQATATGFVSRAATGDRVAASGLYLACYYFGGLVGAAVLGQVYDRFGWTACVGGIGLALAGTAMLATRLAAHATNSPVAIAAPEVVRS